MRRKPCPIVPPPPSSPKLRKRKTPPHSSSPPPRSPPPLPPPARFAPSRPPRTAHKRSRKRGRSSAVGRPLVLRREADVSALLDTRAPSSPHEAIALHPSAPPPHSSLPSVLRAEGGVRARREAGQLRAVRELGELFREVCHAFSNKRWYAHFEAFLWEARSCDAAQGDRLVIPPIPSPVASAASEELQRTLVLRGQSEASAKQAVQQISARAVSLAEMELADGTSRREGTTHVTASYLPTSGGKESSPPLQGEGGQPAAPSSEVLVQLACDGVAVLVSELHLHKMWRLYAPHTQPARLEPFLEAAYAVLARLQSLQGGHECAGGMQAACPPTLFEVLRQDFGVRMELFASPLNTRFPRFCSAAVDVDGDFGSEGSFFGFQPLSGSFVANPPFEPSVVLAMAARMEMLLAEASHTNAVLTFVVVIPRWPDKQCWLVLQGSRFTTLELRMRRSKHAYVDGGQHYSRRRDSRPRLSNHDSSIFFLQSPQAAAAKPITKEMKQRLYEGFRAGW